jgi:Universal stress protein family
VIEADQRRNDAIGELAQGTTVEPDLLFEDPADALVATSESLDALVMGSRAYRPLSAVMLGGTSRQVTYAPPAQSSSCPRGAERSIDSLTAALAREHGTRRD